MKKLCSLILIATIAFLIPVLTYSKSSYKTYTKKEIKNQGFLVLVNKQSRIPSGYKVSNLVLARNKVDVRFYNLYLNRTALNNLKTMFDAASKKRLNFYVYSAYRTEYEQTWAFNNKVKSYIPKYGKNAKTMAAKIVAPPNASEHQIGLAADIVSTEYRVRDAGFAKSKSGKWLAANSWRYGFILRYPANKTKITQIIFEPWHFRYVGKKVASYMYKHKICFKEYCEKL